MQQLLEVVVITNGVVLFVVTSGPPATLQGVVAETDRPSALTGQETTVSIRLTPSVVPTVEHAPLTTPTATLTHAARKDTPSSVQAKGIVTVKTRAIVNAAGQNPAVIHLTHARKMGHASIATKRGIGGIIK